MRSSLLAVIASFTVIAVPRLSVAQQSQNQGQSQGQQTKKDADLQRAQDAINSGNKAKGAVRTDGEHSRVSVENKAGVGVYVEGGGKAPSHDNPKGEKRAGAGVQFRFGGTSK
jgi:hypothetical protein